MRAHLRSAGLPVVCVLAILLVVAALGRAWQSLSASAQAPLAPPHATENGDTNGDGQRDLTDAVYLLTWLYQGGPEPVEIARDCPPRFIDNGDGTVTDTEMGLMWLQRAVDVNGDGELTVEDELTSKEAYAFSVSFEFAGYDDWILPPLSVISTLVVVRDGYVTSTDPVFELAEGSYNVGSSNPGDPCHGAPFTMYLPGGGVQLNGCDWEGPPAKILLVRER